MYVTHWFLFMSEYRQGINAGMDAVAHPVFTSNDQISRSVPYFQGYVLGFGYQQIQMIGREAARQKTLALIDQFPTFIPYLHQQLKSLGFVEH